MKKGLFPGSFDPFTKGHEAIVFKALNLFDEIYIGIGINSTKKYLFDTENRIKHIKELFKKYHFNFIISNELSNLSVLRYIYKISTIWLDIHP